MNREIKFRAWDTKKEKMITSYDDLDRNYMGGESMPLIPLPGGIVRPYWNKQKFDSQPHLKLMQYTGLKDKNGTEIYEGDIVRWDGWLYEIIWDKEYAHFVHNPLSPDCHGDYFESGNNKAQEVIGNVYENPELLNETEVTDADR